MTNTKIKKDDAPSGQADKNQLPIDHGWAWVIVVATFFINLLQVGMYRCYGILFVEFLKEFNASKSVTSLIVGIYAATYSLTTLFVLNFLIEKLSLRVICTLGGVLMSLGGILSYFAMNIEFLIFTQSFLTGVGSALLYGPGIVIIGQYFEKRRALGQAISSCGVSLGGMVLPQLIRYLLNEYGLRGTLLISGGLLSEIIIFTLLYRPAPKRTLNISEQKDPENDAADTFEKQLVNQDEFEIVSIESLNDTEINDDHQGHTVNGMSKGHVGEGITKAHLPTSMPIAKMLLHRREPFRTRTESDPTIISKKTGIIQSLSVPKDSFLSQDSLDDLQNANSETTIEKERASHRTLRKDNNSHSHHTPNNQRKDLSHNYLGSFMDTLSQSSYLQYASNADIHMMSTISLNKPYVEEEMTYPEKRLSCCQKVTKAFDFSVLRLPHFYLILGETMFGLPAVSLFATFLPAFAEEAGLTDVQAALLITIYAGMDCLSRFMSGVIVATGKIRPHHLLASCLIAMGVLYQLTRYYTSMNLMIMYAALFGTFSGALPSMTPVVMIEFLGMDNFPKALGFNSVLTGVVLAAVTPLTGALRDITGTYKASYHLLGSFAFVAASFLLMEPLARRFRDAKTFKVNADEMQALNGVTEDKGNIKD